MGDPVVDRIVDQMYGDDEPEKQYLCCDPCGEVFDTIETARAHEITPENRDYGHEYTIKPESEAF